MRHKFRYREVEKIERKVSSEPNLDPFDEMKTKNPRNAGKTPHYLFARTSLDIAKRKGILIEKK